MPFRLRKKYKSRYGYELRSARVILLSEIRSTKRANSRNIGKPVEVPEIVYLTIVLVAENLAPVELRGRTLKDEVLVGLLALVTETAVFRRQVLPV